MRVLILGYPGCIMFEVGIVIELLHEHTTLELASPEGHPFKSHGLVYTPESSFDDALKNSWDAVVVPGGDPALIMEDSRVDELLDKTHQQGGIVAGICAGVLVMAKTGLLKGRRVTHTYTSAHAPPEVVAFTSSYWEDTVFDESSQVILDTRLISALPQAWVEFGATVAQALGLDVEGAVAYYRSGQTQEH